MFINDFIQEELELTPKISGGTKRRFRILELRGQVTQNDVTV